MAIWLTISFAVMGVDQARYREVVNEAATTGSLVDIYRLLFAPSKEFYPHGGDDCLTLAMLDRAPGSTTEGSSFSNGAGRASPHWR